MPKLHSLCRLLPNYNRSSTKGIGSKDRACASKVVQMTVANFSMTCDCTFQWRLRVQKSQIFMPQVQHSLVEGRRHTSHRTTSCVRGSQCRPIPSNSSSSTSSPPSACTHPTAPQHCDRDMLHVKQHNTGPSPSNSSSGTSSPPSACRHRRNQ